MLTTFLVFLISKLYHGIPDFRFHLPSVTAAWTVSVRGHGTHQKVDSGLFFFPCFPRAGMCIVTPVHIRHSSFHLFTIHQAV